MAKAALRTDDVAIDQARPIEDDDDRKTIVEADLTAVGSKEYIERLAMGEEPVTIRIEPSTDQNAPHSYYCAVNGKGAECLSPQGEWTPIDWVPVGVELVMKRKYVEVLVRAKRDRVSTDHGEANVAEPHNRIVRHTSAIANVVILEDKNPRGPEMFRELRRRNY